MGKCVEDFAVGEVSLSPGRTVTEADIVAYTAVSGDANPMHTDAVYSGRSPLGQRIAHGAFGLSICTGLSTRMGQFDGTAIAALGLDEWRFLAPIFINDTVYLRTTVLSSRVSSKPDRGVVVRLMELIKADGTVAQSGKSTIMTYTRAGYAASDQVKAQELATSALSKAD